MLGLGNTLSGGIVPAVASFVDDYSLLFDGTNDYVDIGDVTILDGVSDVTISVWVNFSTLPSSNTKDVIIGKDEAYELYIYGSAIGDGVGLRANNGATDVSQYDFSTDEWYHVVVVMDSSGKTYYINGSKNGDTLGSQVTINNTSASLLIGGRTNKYFLPGNVDEAAIFDAALGASAISAIYNSGTPTDLSGESGLVGYWKFEENTGTTVADSSDNSNDGSLVNGTAFEAETP